MAEVFNSRNSAARKLNVGNCRVLDKHVVDTCVSIKTREYAVVVREVLAVVSTHKSPLLCLGVCYALFFIFVEVRLYAVLEANVQILKSKIPRN